VSEKPVHEAVGAAVQLHYLYEVRPVGLLRKHDQRTASGRGLDQGGFVLLLVHSIYRLVSPSPPLTLYLLQLVVNVGKVATELILQSNLPVIS
jgi:hypothetical protein